MLDPLSPFFILGYAEFHTRFRFGISLLKRRQPEIYFDVPVRVEKGFDIPVVLIIRDAHLYPLKITKITAASALMDTHRMMTQALPCPAGEIREKLCCRVFHLPAPEGFSGRINLNIKLEGVCRGKPLAALNDNLPFGSHYFFPVYAGADKLPAPPGHFFGETHFHSAFTCDEVEFGVPLSAVPALARPMGLSFAFAQDHSYDLDPRNPYAEDKEPFAAMREEALKACGSDFLLFPGEELSARNSRGRTVHLGLVNPPEFLEGYGDSGRGLRRTCPHSVREIQDRLSTREDALCFAAHPGYRPRFLERMLLNRGRWQAGDFPDVSAASQFWNGGMDAAFFRGRRQWISLLLEGRRIAPLAGNDAHGDFSRVRKIGFPFISVKEDGKCGFGRVRTAVRTDDFSFAGVLSAIRQCRTAVTSGPFASLSAARGNRRYYPGDTATAAEFPVEISGLSSAEFGPLGRMALFKGTLGRTEEKVLDVSLKNERTFERTMLFRARAHEPCYFRAEVSSGTGNDLFLGMTSPLWAKPE